MFVSVPHALRCGAVVARHIPCVEHLRATPCEEYANHHDDYSAEHDYHSCHLFGRACGAPLYLSPFVALFASPGPSVIILHPLCTIILYRLAHFMHFARCIELGIGTVPLGIEHHRLAHGRALVCHL